MKIKKFYIFIIYITTVLTSNIAADYFHYQVGFISTNPQISNLVLDVFVKTKPPLNATMRKTAITAPAISKAFMRIIRAQVGRVTGRITLLDQEAFRNTLANTLQGSNSGLAGIDRINYVSKVRTAPSPSRSLIVAVIDD